MQLRRRSDGQLVTIEHTTPLGKGGEAHVYPVAGDQGLAAKVYTEDKTTAERATKLAVMCAHPPDIPVGAEGHVAIAWPRDLLCATDDFRTVRGFLMPRAYKSSAIIDYYNPHARLEKCPLFDYRYLLRTARNLAAAVRALHARGYVIGDLKHANILVTTTALVTLVDTDSFQVRDLDTGRVFLCPVRTPDCTPPELQGCATDEAVLAPEQDLFGLGVLIFHLLMEGTHPFAGVYEGEGDPPAFEERIAQGHFPYGTRPGPYHPGTRNTPPFDLLPPPLQQLFLRCFEDGHADPAMRPDARTWQNALEEARQALICCTANSQHFYGSHLDRCPWCARTDPVARDRPVPHPAGGPGPPGGPAAASAARFGVYASRPCPFLAPAFPPLLASLLPTFV